MPKMTLVIMQELVKLEGQVDATGKAMQIAGKATYEPHCGKTNNVVSGQV